MRSIEQEEGPARILYALFFSSHFSSFQDKTTEFTPIHSAQNARAAVLPTRSSLQSPRHYMLHLTM